MQRGQQRRLRGGDGVGVPLSVTAGRWRPGGIGQQVGGGVGHHQGGAGGEGEAGGRQRRGLGGGDGVGGAAQRTRWPWRCRRHCAQQVGGGVGDRQCRAGPQREAVQPGQRCRLCGGDGVGGAGKR